MESGAGLREEEEVCAHVIVHSVCFVHPVSGLPGQGRLGLQVGLPAAWPLVLCCPDDCPDQPLSPGTALGGGVCYE